PVISPPPLYPLTAINTDPDKVSPSLDPVSVPPLLVKSTPLLANAAMGSRSARTVSRSSFFLITYCLLTQVTCVACCTRPRGGETLAETSWLSARRRFLCGRIRCTLAAKLCREAKTVLTAG